MQQQATTTCPINFYQAIKAEYNVSDVQIDACQRWERSNGEAFYTVESATTDLCYYRVEWNTEHHCLQCLPHSGEPCKAAQHGMTCWHLRASVASERLYKHTLKMRRQAEAQAIEAEASHREEQACFDLEAAKLNAEAAKREASAVRKHGAKAYEPRAFSLLK